MKKLVVSLGLLLLCCGFANSAHAYSTEGAMYYNEGIDLYSRGEYSRALESFKTAVEKDPDFVDAYFNLGSLYEYLKNYNMAIASFTKINQLEPANTEVIFKLAELYYKTGNQQRALTLVDQIKENDVFYSQARALRTKITEAQANYASKVTLNSVNKADASNKKTLAKFSGPTGMAINSQGVLFVASYTDNCIYKILPNGQAYLYSKAPELGGPIGLAVDEADNLYVANYAKNNIIKINKTGQVFTFIDNIVNPYYLIIKGNQMYITEQGGNTTVRYKLY